MNRTFPLNLTFYVAYLIFDGIFQFYFFVVKNFGSEVTESGISFVSFGSEVNKEV